MIGISSDFSHNESSIASLRESEQFFRALVENHAQAVWQSDASGITFADSPSCRAYTGLTLGEWLEKGWLGAIHPEDREWAMRRWQEAVQSRENLQQEFRLLSSEGDYRWTSITAAPICDPEGKVLKWVGMNVDIHDRKLAEVTCLESQQQLSAFIAATSAIVYRMSVDWQTLYTLQGNHLVADNPRPSREWLTKYIPEDEQIRVMTALRKATAEKEIYELEHRVIQTDGSEGWVFSRALPLMDDDGNIVQWFGAATDITERKRQERRREFLLKLSDVTRLLADPVEIQSESISLLGKELGVDSIHYLAAGSNGEWRVSPGGYSKGSPFFTGQPMLRNYGSHVSESFMQGRVLVMADVTRDLRLSPAELETYTALGFRSFIAIPLIKAGKCVAVIEIVSIEPREWTIHEVSLAEETFQRTWSVVEQARSENDLREEKEKYRNLFESMDEGYCIIQMIYDSDGKAIDWRFIEVNPAFEKHNGMHDATGRSMREMVPMIELKWVDAYNHVAVTGESLRFEESSVPLNRTFDLYAFRVGCPEERKVAVLFTDITQRKNAEAALTSSEENYRTLFESIDEGFCTFEMLFDENQRPVDYRFLKVNPSFERHTGITRAIGRHMREIAPDHEDEWYQIYGEVALTGKPIRFQKMASELGQRYYDLYAFRIGCPESRCVGVLFSDITERKRHEASQAFLVEFADAVGELRDFSSTIRSLSEKIGLHFDVKQCLFSEITKDSEISRVIHGWAGEEIASLEADLPVKDLLTKEQIAASLRGELIVVSNSQDSPRAIAESYASRHIHAFIISPVVDFGELRFLFFISDNKPRRWSDSDIDLIREMTTRLRIYFDRARAKKALRESEERLRVTLESAEMGAWDLDILSNILRWNDQHFRLLGCVPDDVLKSPEDFETFVHPEDLDRVLQTLSSAMKRNGTFECEFRIIRRDNREVRWMSGYGRVVTQIHGIASRMTGVMFDCTDRKITEEQLRLAHLELERRVEERTVELSNTLVLLRGEMDGRLELEHDRHELLRRLVDTQEEERRRISRELHDNLGQYMVAVKLGLDRLESKTKEEDLPSILENLSDVRRLMDLLMKAAHRQAWELRPSELDHLGLAAALSVYVSDWSQRTGILVEFESDDSFRLPPDVEIAFYRIVQESLTNAARHARCTQVSIVLNIGPVAEIIIKDNGIGMKTVPVAGRLGLLGMRERIELIGGSLVIGSRLGKGTQVMAQVQIKK